MAKITTSDTSIASAMAVKVGDSVSEVITKHQNQTSEVMYSPFYSPDNPLITMYYWSGANGQRVGTRYDLLDKKVTSISVGNEDGLMSQEGCA